MKTIGRLGSYVVALATVATLTVVLLSQREVFTIANVTMFFLLGAVLVAVTRGTGPAFVAALASFVCINFFFLQPYYSLLVADPREVLDLIVFVVVGAIAGQLGANVRQQAEDARQQAHEHDILYRLTRAFNQITIREEVLQALAQAVREDFGAAQTEVMPDTPTSVASLPSATTHYLLLQSGDTVYATLRAAFPEPLPSPRIRLLMACAAQAGMALQRIDLNERARRSLQFEEADRLKTALLHAVSHDLRTPITIIKTSASNLRQFGDTLPADEQAEIAITIETEADQLDRLVGNLLDMSRLKAGALRLSIAFNSLEEVAGDVAARMWQIHKQERIHLNFPDNVPLVAFDYGLLLQALTNLVDNALRYEPEGSQVELRGGVRGDEAFLEVVNHGETISDEVKQHMMEPFYRGKEGRIGLGMPIAKGIIEAHKGELRVLDTPGSGATFVLALPFAKESVIEAQSLGRG